MNKEAVAQELVKIAKELTAKIYHSILTDPVLNKRLWTEIELIADEIWWMEDEGGARGAAIVTMKARNLARKYMGGYGGGDIISLAHDIEENIWLEYHGKERQ